MTIVASKFLQFALMLVNIKVGFENKNLYMYTKREIDQCF